MEYSQMADFYDLLYSKKDYIKEVDFLISVFPSAVESVFDAGCGTAEHCKILKSKGFSVSGIDLSEKMVEIANKKCGGGFKVENALNLKEKRKFDVVISMFAVFNHFKNYRQFETAFLNLTKLINDYGVIVIDLHNPEKSGKKKDVVNNIERVMRWRVCRFLGKEFSKIDYIYNEKKYKTKHVFKIYNLNKLKNLISKFGFKVEAFENYGNIEADSKSKNIQLVIRKENEKLAQNI